MHSMVTLPRQTKRERELYALHDITWQKWRKYDNDDNVTAPNPNIIASIGIDH